MKEWNGMWAADDDGNDDGDNGDDDGDGDVEDALMVKKCRVGKWWGVVLTPRDYCQVQMLGGQIYLMIVTAMTTMVTMMVNDVDWDYDGDDAQGLFDARR